MNIQLLQIQLIALTRYQAMEKSRNCCQMIAMDVKNRFISSFPGIHGPTKSLCLRAPFGDVYIGFEERSAFCPIIEQIQTATWTVPTRYRPAGSPILPLGWSIIIYQKMRYSFDDSPKINIAKRDNAMARTNPVAIRWMAASRWNSAALGYWDQRRNRTTMGTSTTRLRSVCIHQAELNGVRYPQRGA